MDPDLYPMGSVLPARARGMTDREVEEVSRSARELAMIRPMNEWRSKGAGALAPFLDQVEELLASSAESKSESL